jgi:hypothetical protein
VTTKHQGNIFAAKYAKDVENRIKSNIVFSVFKGELLCFTRANPRPNAVSMMKGK